MKLRALRLANVRRFGSEGVVIEGIADGLNVFAARNEAGKSTLFDALHALLFVKYTSKARPVSSLKPYAGGWPRIAADVEFDGGCYRVEKQFLGGPFARVVDFGTGQEIARADEAQAWIDKMIGADGETGGPTGLLWVRQGESSNLDQGSNVRAEALENTIEGEVTTLTGGERARRVMERCTGELGGMVTPGGKPKANGAYDQAVREVDQLIDEQTELEAQLDKARDALKERHAKQLLLDELTDPERQREEDERLSDARSAKEAAEGHQESVTRADTHLDLARLAEATAKGARDTFAENCKEARRCREQLDELKALLPERSAAAQAADEEHERLREAAQKADQAREATREMLGSARSAEDARRAKQRHGELSEHLTKAEDAERDGRDKRAGAKALGVEQGDVDELGQLSIKVEKAKTALNTVSTLLRMSYEPDYSKRLTMGGQILEDGVEVRINQSSALAIEGVGSLSVTPGSADSGTDARHRLGTARDALAEKLAQLNCETVDEARERSSKRSGLVGEAEQADAVVQIRAPHGIEALRIDVMKLKDKLDADINEDVPEVATAEQALDLAEAKERKARGDLAAAGETSASATSTLQQLANQVGGLEEVYARDLARAGTPPDEWPARQEQLDADYEEKRREALERGKELQALLGKPIRLEFASAELDRLIKAKENRGKEIGELEKRIAVLRERIRTAAKEGVEEAVSEVEGQLETAQARKAAYEAEMAALRRLKAAVETEVARLKERYLQPVNKEIRPLLELLYPEASLDFDEEKLIPRQLTRAGVSEDIQALSGGTKEQIAILTRLAFARLLARSGHTPPIILDDALIFSDDDRIQRMFTALNAQASDLQMIVFSCRQRAFRDLGGTMLRLQRCSRSEEPIA